MPEPFEKSLLPVFAAMTALDEAIASHNQLSERLAGAMEEGARLDEQLRSVDPADHQKLESAARELAFAVALVQNLARREEQARVARARAQAALAEVRRTQSKERLEELRIELEIDAASIWDMVGRFEAEVRARLEEHARMAAEMHFVALAAGVPEMTVPAAEAILTPAIGASGPDLWNALAGGVRQLYDRHGAPIIGRLAGIARPAAKTPRFDFAKPVLLAETVAKTEPPAPTPPKPDIAPATRNRSAPDDSSVPMEPRFDFARRTVVVEKVAAAQSPAPKKAVEKIAAAQSPALKKTAPPVVDLPKSAAKRAAEPVTEPPPPTPPQRERRRLDQMLRNLVGMAGSKPASRR